MPLAEKGSGVPSPLPIRAHTTEADYKAMVLRAKEDIAAGEIFQVVLSQRFSAPFDLPADIGALAVPDATMLLEDRGQFLPFEFLPEPARHDQHVGLPVERKPLDVVEVGHLSQVIAASMDRRRSASEWAALPPF